MSQPTEFVVVVVFIGLEVKIEVSVKFFVLGERNTLLCMCVFK